MSFNINISRRSFVENLTKGCAGIAVCHGILFLNSCKKQADKKKIATHQAKSKQDEVAIKEQAEKKDIDTNQLQSEQDEVAIKEQAEKKDIDTNQLQSEQDEVAIKEQAEKKDIDTNQAKSKQNEVAVKEQEETVPFELLDYSDPASLPALLGYVHDIEQADKKKYPQWKVENTCEECLQYVQIKKGENGFYKEYGRCKLIPDSIKPGGPVIKAKGWCSVWAAKPG